MVSYLAMRGASRGFGRGSGKGGGGIKSLAKSIKGGAKYLLSGKNKKGKKKPAISMHLRSTKPSVMVGGGKRKRY